MELKVGKKVVRKQVLVHCFLMYDSIGWLEPSYSSSYRLCGYLDSTDRIGKLYSIKWVLNEYPLVAFEVFRTIILLLLNQIHRRLNYSKVVYYFPDKVEASLVLYLIFQPFYCRFSTMTKESCFAKSRESFIKARPFLFVAHQEWIC